MCLILIKTIVLSFRLLYYNYITTKGYQNIMNKSAPIYPSEEFDKTMAQQVAKKMKSVLKTYQLQLKADPNLEYRKAIFSAAIDRRVAEKKALLKGMKG